MPGRDSSTVKRCVLIRAIRLLFQIRSPDYRAVIAENLETMVDGGILNWVVNVNPGSRPIKLADGKRCVARCLGTGGEYRSLGWRLDAELLLQESKEVVGGAQISLRAG